MEREERIRRIARALSNSLIKFDVFNYKGMACAIAYLAMVTDRLSWMENNTKSGTFIKYVFDIIGESYNVSLERPSWRPSTEHPPVDEEVIALLGEENMITFAHIVDKERCFDYDGWNIPDVKCWIPCPKIEED